ERFARDLGEAIGLGDEPRENACPALRGLIEEEACALVARRHRLGKDFALLELKDRLDAAQEGVLQRSERGLLPLLARRLEQQRVLAVLHAGDDPLARRSGRIRGLVSLVLVLCPIAGDGADVESELSPVGPPSKAFVEPRDGGARAVR